MEQPEPQSQACWQLTDEQLAGALVCGEARLRVEQAEATVSASSVLGAEVAPPMPVTGAALAAGELNAEHVAELQKVMAQVSGRPAGTPPPRSAAHWPCATMDARSLPAPAPPNGAARITGCWIDGGPTDLDNLVLLCARHHRRIHHSEWTIRVHNGLPWFIPPRWLDPAQQPLRNRAHDPPRPATSKPALVPGHTSTNGQPRRHAGV